MVPVAVYGLLILVCTSFQTPFDRWIGLWRGGWMDDGAVRMQFVEPQFLVTFAEIQIYSNLNNR